MAADAPQVSVSSNGRRSAKLRLISRDEIDRRTKAFLKFDAIASGIAEDLGGNDRLSTVQKHLVEAFAGVALAVNDLNARLLLGEEVDILEQSQAVSSMVRVAQRIGINRVPRNITPDPLAYAREVAAPIATIAGLREVFSEDERFCIPAEVNTVTAIIQTFVDHLDQAP